MKSSVLKAGCYFLHNTAVFISTPFNYFDTYKISRNSVSAEKIHKLVNKVSGIKMTAGHIDGYRNYWQFCIKTALDKLKHLRIDIEIKFFNLPVLFQHRNKLLRHEFSVFRTFPPCKRFGAGNSSGNNIHLRLIHHIEFAVINSFFKRRFNLLLDRVFLFQI